MAAQIALFLTLTGVLRELAAFSFTVALATPYCAGVRLPGRKTLQPGKGK